MELGKIRVYHPVFFASPLEQGERIKVRGLASGPRTLPSTTLTLPLSLAKGEATVSHGSREAST